MKRILAYALLMMTAVAILSCDRSTEATIFQVYSKSDTLMKRNGKVLSASSDDNVAALWHFFFDTVSTSNAGSPAGITAADSSLKAAGRVWPSMVVSAEISVPQPTRRHPEVAERISDTMLCLLKQSYQDGGAINAGSRQPDNVLQSLVASWRARMEADTAASVSLPQYSYMEVRGTTPLMSDKILTYELRANLYRTGDARPAHVTQYRVFDLTNGAVLHEEDIFNMSPATRDAINNLLREAFEGLRHSDTSGTYGSESVWDFSRMVMNGNFSVREQSLVYHYNAVETPMYEAGTLDLEIPSYQLEPYMKKNTALYKYWFGKKKARL